MMESSKASPKYRLSLDEPAMVRMLALLVAANEWSDIPLKQYLDKKLYEIQKGNTQPAFKVNPTQSQKLGFTEPPKNIEQKREDAYNTWLKYDGVVSEEVTEYAIAYYLEKMDEPEFIKNAQMEVLCKKLGYL